MHASSDRSVVTRDRALPGLATVLDASAAAALVARMLRHLPAGSPRVTYTRYKPGASCLVALQYGGASAADFVTLKAVSTANGDKWAKYRGDAAIATDDALRIAVRRFPVDGALRGPEWLLDEARHERVRSVLGLHPDTRFEVITYKPERRLVLRASVHGLPVAVVKCYDGPGFEHALAAQHALARLPQLPVSPATAWHARRGVIVSPWIEGRVIDVAADPLTCFEAAGSALAAVHDATMDVRAGASESDATVALHRIAQSVAGWAPATREPLRLLAKRLVRHRAEPAPVACAIHGDFYTKQILVHEGAVSLLDFDECVIDDPHIDLANFAAHLERDVLRRAYSRERATRVMEALLSGYRRTRHVDMRRLTWRTAEALVRLAPHPFRHRDPEWPVLTDRLVGRAQALLDGIPLPAPSRPPMRSTAVTGQAVRAWSRLASDEPLAFAATLVTPGVMTDALAERLFSGEVDHALVTATMLMRHKPGRRCMVAIDLVCNGAAQRWLGKVRARGVDSRAALIHRMLWEAGASSFIPEPLGVVDAMHMTLQRAVPGVPLDVALRAGADPAQLGQHVADTVSSLHAVSIDPGRTWRLDDELATLSTRLSSLGSARGELQPALGVLQDALCAVAAPLTTRPLTATVHRDLYHDQVLVHDGRCTLVDLDLVTRGDPALDAGNLVAHLVELQWRGGIGVRGAAAFCRAFCDGIVQRSRGTVTEDAIHRFALLTLGRMLEIASRHPDRDAFLAGHLTALQQRVARIGMDPAITTLFVEQRP